ncbi:hypothetical protein BDN67DRAFT_1071956, partial [Paxillus ammoniavirescens]
SSNLIAAISRSTAQWGTDAYIDTLAAFRLGFDLLTFCIRGGRPQHNYRFFSEFLCQNQVPILRLSSPTLSESSDGWKAGAGWDRNPAKIEEYGFKL